MSDCMARAGRCQIPAVLFGKPFRRPKCRPSRFALFGPPLAYRASGVVEREPLARGWHPPVGIDDLSGLLVDHVGGRLVLGSEASMLHAPLPQQKYHGIQFFAFFRTSVFVSGRLLAV